MFPIVLDLSTLKVALVGGGDNALERLKDLDAAGAKHVRVFADNFGKEFWGAVGGRLTTRLPNDEEIKSFSAIMIVDVPDEVAAKLAERARALGVLVNVEDKKEYCDFFYPSVVRRGDLIITVSTSAKSPTLAKRIRAVIAKIFHKGWVERVEDIAERREKWRKIGLNMAEVSELSNKYIDEQGWLAYEELADVKEKETI
jgi:precorrin-2 dehydrogenase/sirohydrochlorin ferrochelatase